MKKLLQKPISVLLAVLMVLGVGFTVNAATKVKINKTKMTLYVGASSQLKITGTSKNVTWSTDKVKVAKVSKSGKVTALKAGTATVKAKVGKAVKKCKVTVKNPYLKTTKVSVYAGKTKTLKLVGADIKAVSSSDKSIVTIAKSGKLTAKKAGSATVTVKDSNGTKHKCKVTVKKVYINKTKVILYVGNSTTVKLVGTDIKAVSSSDKSVATVAKSGKITAKKAGSTTVALRGTNGKRYVCKVTVIKELSQSSNSQTTSQTTSQNTSQNSSQNSSQDTSGENSSTNSSGNATSSENASSSITSSDNTSSDTVKEETVTTLYSYTPITVGEDESEVYLSFIPVSSGSYTLYSYNSTADAFVELYCNEELLASDDNSSGGTDFSLTYSLVKDTEYIICVKSLTAGSYKVMIKDTGTDVFNPEDGNVSGWVGED